jgi:ABC-2 type transport system ATP-binding protein
MESPLLFSTIRLSHTDVEVKPGQIGLARGIRIVYAGDGGKAGRRESSSRWLLSIPIPGDTMGTAIRVERLAKRFGDCLAVDSISFDVPQGEILGFLGPNGAGKTTTQRMITGVLAPTSGDAYVLEHNVSRDPVAAKERIGVVPEVANPYLELSGWKNLMLMGDLCGVPRGKRNQRGRTLLERFDLWDRRADHARAYSKGMRQRLMLAMALIHEPRVLFLDEPTAGLDVLSRRLIHATVRQLATDGVTVFYTTHNIEEANVLCHRVAIINGGRLAAVDTPERLKAAFARSQRVQVAFAEAVEPEDLSSLPGVAHAESTGDKIELYTDSPGRLCQHLMDFARGRNMEIVSLNTLGPSLEEVFLLLTGNRREGGQ